MGMMLGRAVAEHTNIFRFGGQIHRMVNSIAIAGFGGKLLAMIQPVITSYLLNSGVGCSGFT